MMFLTAFGVERTDEFKAIIKKLSKLFLSVKMQGVTILKLCALLYRLK